MRLAGLAVALALSVACSGNGATGEDADSGVTPDVRAPDAGDRQSDAGPETPAETEDLSGPEVVVDPDSGLDIGSACSEGSKKCDGENALLCQGSNWTTAQVCGDPMICLDGMCVTGEECQPGFIDGCFSLSAMKLCHVSGKGFVPMPCPEGEKCAAGKCAILECNPGVTQCSDAKMYIQCLEDGSGWSEPIACPSGNSCVAGQCLSGCAGDIKYNMSNVGCEFYSIDLGQWHPKPGESQLEPSAANLPHSVVIGNPGEFPVHVNFEVADGTPVSVPDNEVAPGESKAFIMPVLSQQESGITKQSIRVITDHPVTAAQFNPPNNEDFVHTSDASLLYPINVLGTEHYVASFPSVIGPELPMIGKMPSVFGYVTVVAVKPGITNVTMVLTADTEPGPGFPAYKKGDVLSVDLDQYEVLTVNGKGTDGLSLYSGPDISGTHVVTTLPTAVFSGHQCYVIGDSNCDHLETQLLPVEAWGIRYVAGRMQTPAPNQYRVMSGLSDNLITTKPSVSGLDGKVLNKGDWVHAEADFSFQVEGTGPIQVIQYIAGNNEGGAVLVDPSMTNLIPTHGFRADYPILVPTAYEMNFVNVVVPAGAQILLNGAPQNVALQAIPGTGWEAGNLPVGEGIQFIESTEPFGLVSYGYANKTAYSYPGGMNAVGPEE